MALNKRPKRPLRKKAPIARIKRKISRKKIITEKVISPRYKANLLEPGKAFVGKPRETLLSTCFAKHQYDPKTRSLKVWFWGYKQRYISGVYILWEISPEEFGQFINASSKGRFFYYTWRYPNGSNPKPYTKVS